MLQNKTMKKHSWKLKVNFAIILIYAIIILVFHKLFIIR